MILQLSFCLGVGNFWDKCIVVIKTTNGVESLKTTSLEEMSVTRLAIASGISLIIIGR